MIKLFLALAGFYVIKPFVYNVYTTDHSHYNTILQIVLFNENIFFNTRFVDHFKYSGEFFCN